MEALAALLGRDAPNLSPSVIGRLTADWQAEYDRWQRRALSARRYVYIWADGVYLQARMEPQAECMLVIIGATPEGRKELVGFQVGVRESTQSWRELLVDLKTRGLAVQPTIKADLREVWQAPDRATAEAAIDSFAEKYAPKYQRAVDCLVKDRTALLAFFDFPADDWDHLRTANPIKSVFATVRHRTVRTEGALSQNTARLMVFKLTMAASKTWRRLKGQNQLPKLVEGVRFREGVEVTNAPAHNAA